MTSLTSLRTAIDRRQAVVGVVGLGYVGLPVACAFAAAGFRVIGVDVDADRVEAINRGESPIGGNEPTLTEAVAETTRAGRLIATTDHGELAEASVVTVNVQTPIDSQRRPDYRFLESAAAQLGSAMSPGTLVIVESTVAPGTTEGFVRSILERSSGMQAGVDFFLGACPERVSPGRLLANLREVARVCGAPTPEIAETMRDFYRSVVSAPIDLASTTTAELVKAVENTYRDVQIAFANEVALICEELGEDVWQVRELVNKVPFRDMHRPGGGVGGHCIPKDPWLLSASVERDTPLIRAARGVNDGMPHVVAQLVKDVASWMSTQPRTGKRGERVLVLGYGYLAGSDDVRNSPSETLVRELQSAGMEVLIHDPLVSEFAGDPLDLSEECGVAVLMVHHPQYRDLRLDDRTFLIDAERLGDARRRLVAAGGRAHD